MFIPGGTSNPESGVLWQVVQFFIVVLSPISTFKVVTKLGHLEGP